MIGKADVVGSWRLDRWRRVFPDGTEEAPHSEGNRGRILYADDGHMAAFLMHPGWIGSDRPGGLESLAYGGSWTMEGDEIHHRVDIATIPGMIGRTLVREARLEGGRLVLEAHDEPGVLHRLEWVREGGTSGAEE